MGKEEASRDVRKDVAGVTIFAVDFVFCGMTKGEIS